MLSSLIIFALVLLLPAMTEATAVLRRQVVTVCNVAQGDAGVSSPVTSVEEPDEAFSVTLSRVDSTEGGSLLHKVVWYLFCISYIKT